MVEGCNADVVTLALEHDIDLISANGLIDPGWIDEFDKDSAPYTSTIVFLVRKGNDKNIQDWNDLIKDDVEVITPDPKSSGGACWNFLAALAYARTTFVENGKGDVLIAWENEAIVTLKEYPEDYEIINPSVSILAQPSVAVVDDNARLGGTEVWSTEDL